MVERAIRLQICDHDIRVREELHQIRQPAMLEAKVYVKAYNDLVFRTGSER